MKSLYLLIALVLGMILSAHPAFAGGVQRSVQRQTVVQSYAAPQAILVQPQVQYVVPQAQQILVQPQVQYQAVQQLNACALNGGCSQNLRSSSQLRSRSNSRSLFSRGGRSSSLSIQRQRSR